jgi:glucose-1-phosphate adenylyltransferase
LALAEPDPPFNFHDLVRPIYTHPRFLPGSRMYNIHIDRVLLSDGCIMEGAEIHNAVIGVRSVIADDVVIEDTVMMGADHYDNQFSSRVPGDPPIGIGKGSRIRGAIIDKNAQIGEHVRIAPFARGTDIDDDNWTIRDGLVVIPKNSVLPDKTIIAPPED